VHGVHCNHRTKQPGNDDCSEGLVPAKAVHLTDKEVKKLDEVLAINPYRRTVATAWLPSSGAFFLDRNVYYKLYWNLEALKARLTRLARVHRLDWPVRACLSRTLEASVRPELRSRSGQTQVTAQDNRPQEAGKRAVRRKWGRCWISDGV